MTSDFKKRTLDMFLAQIYVADPSVSSLDRPSAETGESPCAAQDAAGTGAGAVTANRVREPWPEPAHSPP